MFPNSQNSHRQMSVGQFSVTLLETDPTSGKQMVIKVVEKRILANNNLLPMFQKYLNSVQNISSPFIQPFSEVTETETQIILKRPFMEGFNLFDYVSQHCQDEDKNILFVYWKVIVRTVQHLHRYDIFPNFIKPSNIFITGDNKIILTDLYQPPSHQTVQFRSLTTKEIAFFPPEFFTSPGNKEFGREADVWALGVLLYFVVTGKVPWNSRNLMAMSNQIIGGDVSNVIGDGTLQADVKEIVLKILVLAPNERISTDQMIMNKNPGVHMKKQRTSKSHDGLKNAGLALSRGIQKIKMPPGIQTGAQMQKQAQSQVQVQKINYPTRRNPRV